MSENPPEHNGPEQTRMTLEPDAIHERDAGLSLDCPQCGSNVAITHIVNEGQCPGQLAGEVAETADDTELQDGCDANLSLELVWNV